ncbi:hypothetical protein [Microbacterium paludicola]|uniref:hypothetical protein n=1 Tax=Microbacterium paludicola TaxID=300019 RepID=UPI0031D694FB
MFSVVLSEERRGEPRLILADFEAELGSIEAEYRLTIRSFEAAFNQSLERAELSFNPEHHDWGDVYYEVQKEIGFAIDDAVAHAGMSALSRSMFLAEVTMARMAATVFTDPTAIVYDGDRLWTRKLEGAFYYKRFLREPLRTRDAVFEAVRELRDLYAHGYGRPVTLARLDYLGMRLHQAGVAGEITEEEQQLGYEGEAFFFGPHGTYSASERAVTTPWGLPPSPHVSPLGVHRLLRGIRQHVTRAARAVESGVIDDSVIGETRFARLVWGDYK